MNLMILVYVLLFINFALVIFIVFTIERLVMIMKSNTLTELLKYKQEQKKGFVMEEKNDDYMP